MGTNYVVTTLAGKAGSPGWVDGTGSNARFSYPLGGICLDAAGAVYVTDAGMVRKITPVGTNWVVTTIAGSSGATGWVNGTGSDVRFYWPQAVAADSAGNLYVADSNNHAIRIGVPSSVAPPPFQIGREENHVILSWPLSAAGFVPETLSALRAGVAWTPLTGGVAISGSRYVLTNRVSSENAVYRLHLK